MAQPTGPPSRLSIDVDPELRRRVKVAAAQRDQSIKEYVERLIVDSLAAEPVGEEGWQGLSARSFARDWLSAEDSVYGTLA